MAKNAKPETKAPKPETKPAKEKAPKAPKLTKYQKFEMVEIRRSQINLAPYNPRTITPDAEKKLRKKTREVGLLGPMIWNKRSGTLVSGHRRTEQLDILEGYPEKTPDYILTVAMVDLDDKTEKEMNIFLNNISAQGSWDIDKLKLMIETEGVSWQEAGFDMQDMAVLDIEFDTMGLSGTFGGQNDPDADAQMDGIDGARAAENGARNAAQEKVRQDRQEYRAGQDEVNQADFFLNLVFQTKREKSIVLTALKMFPHQEFVKSERLFAVLDEYYAASGTLADLLRDNSDIPETE